MYAIDKGYETADVRVTSLKSILNVSGVMRLSDAAKLPEGVPEPCGAVATAWRGCNVPLSYRFKISQQLLTPYLMCAPRDGLVDDLTIHLRNLETKEEFYRQPPCAMYADLIENSTFNKVNIIMGGGPDPSYYRAGADAVTEDDNFPCKKIIEDACENRTPPCSVEVYDHRSLTDDACDVVMARNLVLSRSTFADNLLLLGPQRKSVFGMVPCLGCRVDPFQYYQLDSGYEKPSSKYYREMCHEFGNAFVGYEVPKAYVNYHLQKGTNYTRSEKAWKSKVSQMMKEFGVKRVVCSRNTQQHSHAPAYGTAPRQDNKSGRRGKGRKKDTH
jgi:hypothetical protein